MEERGEGQTHKFVSMNRSASYLRMANRQPPFYRFICSSIYQKRSCARSPARLDGGLGAVVFRCRECNPSCTCRLIHPEIERNSGSITFGAALVHAQTVGANPYTKSQGPGGPAQQRVLLCADNLRVSDCVKDSYPPASSRVSLATQR